MACELNAAAIVPYFSNDYIFYVGNNNSLIGPVSFDCKSDQNFTVPHTHLRDLVIDTTENVLFVTSGGSNAMHKIDFDGTVNDVIHTNLYGEIQDIAQVGSTLYYSTVDGSIVRVEKDGSNPVLLYSTTIPIP